MSSFKRTAAVWVLRQAARRAFNGSAQRRPGGASTGWARSTGSYPPAGGQPGTAYPAGMGGVPRQVEDLVRRAWPLLDTPANRERAARFVERMRAVANTPR